ncbi:MAG: energy transducer TonB [Ignavibacteria bacterium]|nr:energy transducer TonB [Ignavibacteria bacterium]
MKSLLLAMFILIGAALAQSGEAKSIASFDKKAPNKLDVEMTADKKAPAKLDIEVPSDSIYLEVDKMPEPIGGMEGIMKLVVYPEDAKNKQIQGMVVVSGVIDEKGIVVSSKVEKGIGYGCDEAALKALTSTKWIPGVHKGKKVKVRVALPVMFKLQ